MAPGSGGGAAASAPPLAAEGLLDRLCKAQNGEYYMLVKLRGSGVPTDLDLFFCKNKFAVLQVRVKNLVVGEVHEYATGASDVKVTGGVYDLKCRRCAHELQVKVQPALGLLDLLKPPPYTSIQEVDAILRRLQAVAGLYHMLLAFQRDPTREEVPLASAAVGATRQVARLTAQPEVLDFFFEKCPVFIREGEAKAPRVRLADCTRPRSRGMLLKALLEIKMLIVIAVEHFQADESQFFTQQQLQEFHNFLIEIHEDCLAGGAAAQYRSVEDSWESLKALICGPSVSPAAEAAAAASATDVLAAGDDGGAKLTVADAWKVLQDCVANLKNSVLPRLQQRGQAIVDLELPSTDFASAAGGALFKSKYCRIWRRAIDAYLFDLVHSSQYAKGPEQGLAMIRSQWSRPDKALRLACPSVDLETMIASSAEDLDALLEDKENKRKHGTGGNVNVNPRNSTGLINPGENLCAANALLQLLFSAEPFREAVLQVPEPADGSGAGTAAAGALEPAATPAADSGPAAAGASAPLPTGPGGGGLQSEARQLVAGLRRLFAEMAQPERALTSARDVAAALYGKELGQQQDCDELMHRLSLLLQDGLGAVPGRPYEDLRRTFQRFFVGATIEARLKGEAGDGGVNGGFHPFYPAEGAAKPKEFLTIPVQEGNRTVSQALEDFTAWSSTGGSEVPWTQERLRTVPPFLCFASRNVSALTWEESLNLTRYAAASSTSMEQRAFERSRAQQFHAELKEALQHLVPASRSMAKASRLGARNLFPLADELVRSALRALEEVEAQLPSAAARAAELDRIIGDGIEEPPLEEFLRGVPEAGAAIAALREGLKADTVKALADAALAEAGGDDTTAAWRRLIEDNALPAASADAIVAKLRRRRDELSVHMFDVHAIIVYMGFGQSGHYVAFIRQPDGAFLCFDDEQVTELPGAAAVRAEIDARGAQGCPASVRMVAYRRRGAGCAGALEPLEIVAPAGGANGTSNGAGHSVSGADGAGGAGGGAAAGSAAAAEQPTADESGDGNDPKRRRTG